MTIDERAQEIADFLNQPIQNVKGRLAQGFHYNHALVADDFREANPTNDDELLEWYRNTTAYIYELTAYHLEEGFNYSGMCDGIAAHLAALGKKRALVLGDGVGTLSLRLAEEGLTPIYNDLAFSKTAEFAINRFDKAGLDVKTNLTETWTPTFRKNNVDAIVALDFFEHLTEVETWVQETYKTLREGGQFQAQNAFAIGDDEHGGSIPMHLTRNNRFEHDWIPLLEETGFVDQGNGWWTK